MTDSGPTPLPEPRPIISAFGRLLEHFESTLTPKRLSASVNLSFLLLLLKYDLTNLFLDFQKVEYP